MENKALNQISVLYYYSDYTSSSAPKVIYFRQALLGHANAMAIDVKPANLINVNILYNGNIGTNNKQHCQDIAYSPLYGLFVPTYYNKRNSDGTYDSSTINVMMCYDIQQPKASEKEQGYISPYCQMRLSRESDANNNKLEQYEIESVDFTNNFSSGAHKMLLSANLRAKKSGAGCIDAIELSSNIDSYFSKQLSEKRNSEK